MMILIALVMGFASCAPTLDGSSDDAFKDSVDRVTKSLQGDEALKFASAMMQIGLSEMDFAAVMAGEADASDTGDSLREKLDGKTADQVIAIAGKLEVERKARERRDNETEVAGYYDIIDKAEAAKADLAKFEVTKSRFYMRNERYGQDQPIIELEMTNNTGQSISRVFMVATIASEGRDVPWFQEDFNFSIPGGIQAGESKQRSLAPNSYGDWGKVEAPKDAPMTVEVVRLLGADDEILYDATGLDKYDQIKLDVILKAYPDLAR